jgi:uncharacterized cupin superfamily protein
MPPLDPLAVPVRTGSTYPEPYASAMGSRSFRDLGDAAGLTQFGVVLVTMAPGASSSLRHWHAEEDEFVMVTEGELVLVLNDGAHLLRAGDCAGFPKGLADGHHLQNRSQAQARFLVAGWRAERDVCTYSDVDLVNVTEGGRSWFETRDGTYVKEAV